jgi:1-acyl-sn-glycerol-3-phosphate acyltransferase
LVGLLQAANIKVMTAETQGPGARARRSRKGNQDVTVADDRNSGGSGGSGSGGGGDGGGGDGRGDAAENAQQNDVEKGAGRGDLPEKRFVSRVLHAANRSYTHLYHHLEVFAPSKLPKTGPAIVVCNHTSPLDPHLIQSPCPRLITWMMAKEYYDLWFLKPVFEQLGVIPVTRSGRDTSAMRAAMRALANGQLVGIFPEGRIENSRELFPFQIGVALMAMKTGVPVYPAFLDGTQRYKPMLQALLLPQRAQVIFGDEVMFDRGDNTRDGLSAATTAIQSAVEALRDRMDKFVADQWL